MVEITEVEDTEKSSKVREEGNQHFKSGEYEKAAACYLKSLKIAGIPPTDKANSYKNLAATYLKLKKYQDALDATEKALDIVPNDVKSLFRRAQAFEGLERYSDAMKDALRVQHLEPKNESVKETLRRLNEKLQSKQKEEATTSNRVATMFKYVFDEKTEPEKREQAAENLIVLARDRAGAELIVASNGLESLLKVVQGRNEKVALSAVRTISELIKDEQRCRLFFEKKGILSLLSQLIKKDIGKSKSEERESILRSIQYTIQVALCTLGGFELKESAKTPNTEKLSQNKSYIDELMSEILNMVKLHSLDGETRDALIEIIMKNVQFDAVNWANELVRRNLLENLLQVASELEDVHYESSMDITCNTRPHIALALEKIYSNLESDTIRESFRNQVSEFLKEKLRSADFESKVRATAVITTLLQGPIEVGNFCLSQQGLVEMMLVMAGCDDDEVQQKVAAEAIIAAASKKDKCAAIVTMGTNILKKLYQSKNDSIKVRGLVGLCKLGSVGGTDASVKPFSDGSIHKLVKACKKFLTSPEKGTDLKKWAAEGFAYLTLDADVKEELVDDEECIKALIALGSSGNLSCLYGVITTLVNLTNSYDKNEILPEMVELAKFAKQHVPEEHVKDKPEYVEKRVVKLANMNVASALIGLSKTHSQSARELISRLFNAICERKEFRGSVVSIGGAKTLLNLCQENNTDNGKVHAAQALARIAITMDPSTAFPGQRAAEVVRPIMTLLHIERTGLQNFEALMALTNLATVSDTVANRILQDCGLSKIENYMYEDHTMLRRAATQCVSNLITLTHAIEAYESPNDRVKMLTVLCEEDDLETAKAAAGALAMLTSVSGKACSKVFSAKRWFEILLMLVSSKDQDLQHRGMVIARNIMLADKECAEKIVSTTIFDVMQAVVLPVVDDIPERIKDVARDAISRAQQLGIMRPACSAQNDSEGEDDSPD